ncbi:MAG: DNA recombination protein RmuC [Candidatus Pacebacteria bacterium]|nr:DNA recombination protein RmuC [Candidatus Paceibacterota bacterium]
MPTDLIFIILLIIIGFISLYFLIKRLIEKSQTPDQIEDIVNQVFGKSAAKIAEQSKQILASEKETIQTDLANKQNAIEKLVINLQDDIKIRQDEIRNLEKDRTQKFSEINKTLEQHKELTQDLKISTEQLSKVLSNNQSRGAWGERIIEDLLLANGLVEGIHYLKQTKQSSTTLKPDITLLLPNDRNVPIDVKFPYSEIQKLSEAQTKSAKLAHLKQFSQDLKTKIDKVATYIDPTQNTLDYAIMFVPNEMVFSFINQKMPELVDRAISKKVLIVSPFTFLIVARTVMESYRNFMIGDKLKEVVSYVDDFVSEWSKFRDKFDKYGRSLATLQKDYEEITGTRVKQMERKISKIEDVRQGNLLEQNKDQLLK